MSNKIATAGNMGKKVRSDCFVTLELKDSGGISIEQKSKVQVMYGESNKKLCEDILSFFEIKNAQLTIEDSGALPLVIAARIEAAVKELIDTDKEYLLDIIEENKYTSEKEQFRFSRLYLPGNTPSMMLNAGIHDPNGIILDLEDSVAFNKKKEAQLLVRNALRGINFYGAERMVRINQFPKGLEDIKYLIPHNVHMLLVPKCEGADQIKQLEVKIDELRKQHKVERPIYLMPIIESALGVEKAFEIATASENVVAMAIGLEDYTADLGARRTNEAVESFYARTRMVNACKAARIQAIDSVFSDVADMDALRENVKTSKGLGFEGMGCIHPRQIKVIHESFAPEAEEIDKAKKIVNAFIDATEKGLGVVSLGTKMIDPPVVKRAEKTINLAISLGLISENWREEFLNEQAG
ncbi:MAG: HpcH/HpaI aldolase/citrate lyase family protein [Bacteroidetes bacterium]|nr:HpcH/HpaI aldolase/citrate lyase family protein [Bacteroidota bacterium]